MTDKFTHHDDRLNLEELPFDDGRGSADIRKMRYAIERMEHELFFLYVFLTSEGICEEACEYLENHAGDPVPFHYISIQ